MSNEKTDAALETKTLQVIDSSCTHINPTRIHEIIVGGKLDKGGRVKQVAFKYGEKTLLPVEEALMFRKMGFTVLDEDGTAYEPAKPTDSVIASRLKKGEVVANLTELKRDALFLRASVIPGGDKLKNAKNDELIAFLLENEENPIAEGGASSTDGQKGVEAGATVGGSMSQAEINAMLSKEGEGEDDPL